MARDHILFVAFWSAVVVLGTIEYLAPQFAGGVDRRRRWFTNFGLGILNALMVSALPAGPSRQLVGTSIELRFVELALRALVACDHRHRVGQELRAICFPRALPQGSAAMAAAPRSP
jgi:hypothetical protein